MHYASIGAVCCSLLFGLACGDDHEVPDATVPLDAQRVDVTIHDGGSLNDAGDDATFDAPSDVTPDAGDDAGPIVNPRALFVSLGGDDGNDGRTRESALRTISHAARTVVAGETIYVEAGTYAGENIVFNNEGRLDARIVLEGYRNEPGDRPSFDAFAPGVDFEPERMPLLDGGNRDEGIAILLGDFVTVRNLQITNYNTGINGYGSQNGEVHQTYLSTFGVNDDEVYSGKGIIIGSMADSCIVTGSVVINAGAEGIMLYANNSRIDDCVVYGTVAGENRNSPDYYMMIKGDDNIIENSRVERRGEQWHGGHGIGIKGHGENNIIRHNEAVGFRGSSFYLRHRGVMNNLLHDNLARDTADHGGSGIDFRDGASHNIVERHQTNHLARGMSFYDTTEDDGRHFSGNDNIVRDSQFRNTTYGVAIHDYTYDDVYARRNIIENSTFEDIRYLFDLRSFGEDNMMRGCAIRRVSNYIQLHNGRSASDLGFSFDENTIEESVITLP